MEFEKPDDTKEMDMEEIVIDLDLSQEFEDIEEKSSTEDIQSKLDSRSSEEIYEACYEPSDNVNFNEMPRYVKEEIWKYLDDIDYYRSRRVCADWTRWMDSPVSLELREKHLRGKKESEKHLRKSEFFNNSHFTRKLFAEHDLGKNLTFEHRCFFGKANTCWNLGLDAFFLNRYGSCTGEKKKTLILVHSFFFMIPLVVSMVFFLFALLWDAFRITGWTIASAARCSFDCRNRIERVTRKQVFDTHERKFKDLGANCPRSGKELILTEEELVERIQQHRGDVEDHLVENLRDQETKGCVSLYFHCCDDSK